MGKNVAKYLNLKDNYSLSLFSQFIMTIYEKDIT